jgi:hypothetical protein
LKLIATAVDRALSSVSLLPTLDGVGWSDIIQHWANPFCSQTGNYEVHSHHASPGPKTSDQHCVK